LYKYGVQGKPEGGISQCGYTGKRIGGAFWSKKTDY
jgi:hypothetical protein